MATGILSVAMTLLHFPVFSVVLFVVAAVALVTLVGLNAARFVRHRTEVIGDLLDPRTNVGFFTLVAGTGVVGVRFIADGHTAIAAALWGLAAVVWVVLTYGLATVFVVAVEELSLSTISANWYLMVVATQSLSVLATDLSARMNPHPFLFAGFALWAIGLAQYVVLAIGVSARLLFGRVKPPDFTPHYWVSMGALAISSLAGSRLMAAAPRLSFLVGIRPFVGGTTLAVWAIAAWWIPLLVILEVWRLRRSDQPLRHDPRRWATVFPLGMFTVATTHLGAVIGIGTLITFAKGFLWVAVAAWVIAATATIAQLPDRLGRGRGVAAEPAD